MCTLATLKALLSFVTIKMSLVKKARCEEHMYSHPASCPFCALHCTILAQALI